MSSANGRGSSRPDTWRVVATVPSAGAVRKRIEEASLPTYDDAIRHARSLAEDVVAREARGGPWTERGLRIAVYGPDRRLLWEIRPNG